MAAGSDLVIERAVDFVFFCAVDGNKMLRHTTGGSEEEGARNGALDLILGGCSAEAQS